MKQMLIFWVTGLFCLLLLGCGQEVTAVSTPTSLAQLPIETASQTPSPSPTDTATPAPTTLPATSPAITYTPTATSTPDHVDFPTWVSDPDTNVLLLSTTNLETRSDYDGPYLINIQTGEEFSVPIQGGNISWVQGESGVQLEFSYREERSMLAYEMIRPVVTIDLATGLVSHNEIVRNTLEEDLDTKTYPSPDGRFTITILQTETSPPQVSLANEETDTEIELLDPFSGLFPDIVRTSWSSASDRMVVQRIRLIEDEMARYGLRAESAFAVYDLSGSIVTQHQDVQHQDSFWSPQPPSRLLFPASYEFDDQVSCILEIDSELYTCLNEITEWRNENDVEIDMLRWAPDGDKISFIYWEAQGGGFCYLELSSRQISCPVTWSDLQIEEYLQLFDTGDGAYVFVTNYVWSPDSNFIALYVNPVPPSSDDRTMETMSVTNVTGDWLAFIGKGFPSYFDPWRPTLDVPEVQN